MTSKNYDNWQQNVIYAKTWDQNDVHSSCNHSLSIACCLHLETKLCKKIEKQFNTSNVKRINSCQYEIYFFDGKSIFRTQDRQGRKLKLLQLDNLITGLHELHCSMFSLEKECISIEEIFNIMLTTHFPDFVLTSKFDEGNLHDILAALEHQIKYNELKTMYWKRREIFSSMQNVRQTKKKKKIIWTI
jgi:hypothetical protein